MQQQESTVRDKVNAANIALSMINHDRILIVGHITEDNIVERKSLSFFCVALREGKYVLSIENLNNRQGKYTYCHLYTDHVCDTVEACADIIMETKQVKYCDKMYNMQHLYTRDKTIMHLKIMLPQAKIEDILRF